MESENAEREQMTEESQETPVCSRCFQPVDPRAYYCPYCGQATGQLTPYIPFVNIPWQAGIWGQAWRQVWSRDISVAGRLFRLFMIVWNVPILLIGLIPQLRHKPKEQRPPDDSPGDEDDSASD